MHPNDTTRKYLFIHSPPLFHPSAPSASPSPRPLGVGLSGLSGALHDLSADGLGSSSGVKNLPEVLHLQFPFSAVSLHHFVAHITLVPNRGFSVSVSVFDCFVVLLALSCV
jgi:hypothetical protein